MAKLFPAPDADTRLLQVVRRDQESMFIAVPVYQGLALVVITVFRQAVAHPADANVIRTVQRDAVPGQRAIGGRELVAARAGVGSLRMRIGGSGSRRLRPRRRAGGTHKRTKNREEGGFLRGNHGRLILDE